MYLDIASVMREIPLPSDVIFHIVDKLTSQFPVVEKQALPPLVYQAR